MAEQTRHTRSIYALEAFVRATFTDIIPTGDGWSEKTVALQKEYKSIVRISRERFHSLRANLTRWETQVRCGGVEFDAEQEDEFKGALCAFISLSELLIRQFDIFHKSGIFLEKPRFVSLVESQRNEAQTILDSWKSPEWETANTRTVKWNKEQTRYLREKLDSCN